MNRKYMVAIAITVLLTAAASCTKLMPQAPAADETLDGPLDGLTGEQLARHAAGDAAFTGQVFTPGTGLGPLFVATSCAGCHAGDGKGTPFTTLTRFGQSDSAGNKYLAQGGPQLQDRGIPGCEPELIPAGATFTRLTPPANSGLGFIELVSDADILAMAAANKHNPDGVRGHPNWNYIPSYVIPDAACIPRDGKYICRFGKKGAVHNLMQQTVGAYNQDMGITSSFNPLDAYTLKEVDPEVSNQVVLDVVFYLQTLKAPVQRNKEDANVQKGNEVFIKLGCEACHKQTLTTGYSPLEPLSYKQFHPFTDLLVHDMGAGLDDGYTEGNATTAEWRTPALWGLGLSPRSQGGRYFLLHDGRAHSIEEAILQHGGEAAASRLRFSQLNETDKSNVVAFLESL